VRSFSWPEIEGPIDLVVRVVGIDDRTEGQGISDEPGTALSLAGLDEWERCEIEARITDPRSLAVAIGYEGRIDVTIQLSCASSNTVMTVPTERDGVDLAGRIAVARRDLRNRSKISAFVTAEIDGIGARVIGESNEVDFDVDRPIAPPTGGGPLAIKKASFSSPGAHPQELRTFADAHWHLHDSGGTVTLYLNEDREDFIKFLDRRVLGGVQRASRDVLVAEMWESVFVSIALAAIAGVRDTAAADEDGTPELPARAEHRSLIERIAKEEGVSVDEFLEDVVGGAGFGEIAARISALIHRMVKVDDRIARLSGLITEGA